MGSIPGIEFCDNLCYFKNSLFIGVSPLCKDLLTYDNGCTLMYLCLRAQIEMLYGNKGVYRGLTQYEISTTDIFANRRISVDKEKNRSQKANNLLSFGEYPCIQGLDRGLKMHGYKEIERLMNTAWYIL